LRNPIIAALTSFARSCWVQMTAPRQHDVLAQLRHRVREVGDRLFGTAELHDQIAVAAT